MENYIGRMVMKVGGTLGTVLDINNYNEYYTIAWYHPDRIDIHTGVHYTHIAGWIENLKHRLSRGSSVG